MKKNLLILLIGIIIGTTITATAAYVYTARDIGYSPSDENWNVTNAGEAISSLKEDLNNVNTNINEYKQQITEALSDKGVEVDENSSMEDITSGINGLSDTLGLDNYTMITKLQGGSSSVNSINVTYKFTKNYKKVIFFGNYQAGGGNSYQSCTLSNGNFRNIYDYVKASTYSMILAEADDVQVDTVFSLKYYGYQYNIGILGLEE